MATVSERLALIITANGGQAISELNRIGASAQTNLGRTEDRISRVSNRMTSMGAGAVAAGAVVASGLYQAAQASQDLADSVDKANATFSSSKGIESWAMGAADSAGLSKAAALDAASAYGLMLKQANLGGEALSSVSAQLAQRTADLAEKFKKPYEEVQAAIEATIKTGSAKSLKGLLGIGVQIDPASLKDLDTAGKATKVYQEILKQTADAAGTVAASSDDIGVRAAQAQAKFQNALAEFGQGALPVLTKLFDIGNRVLGLFEKLPDPLKDLLGGLAAVGAVGSVAGGALSVVGGGLLKLAGPGGAAGAAFKEAGGGMAGLAAGAATLNPLVIGLTAAVAGGLGVYEAWSSAQEQNRIEAEQLSSALKGVRSEAEALQAQAGDLNGILSRVGSTEALNKAGISISQVIAAVNSAPGAFDKFRDEVDGVWGSLENLGGISGDLLNIGGGIDGFRASAEKAPKPVRDLINELADLYEAGTINDGELRALVDSFTSLDQQSQSAGEGVGRSAKKLWEYVAGAQRGADAAALFNTATSETAGAAAQAAALAELIRLFPAAATEAGLLAKQTGETTAKVDELASAFQNLAAAAPGSLGEVSNALSATVGAINSVNSASSRLAAANKRVADLTNKDSKSIRDAYERIIDAKKRLDDVLRGDGNNLEQESPEATLARARARLAEANASLAANPRDARAQTQKDEALGDIERAIQRRQDLARTADETFRQVQDAQDNLSKAQADYAEAIKPPDAAEMQQALADQAAARASYDAAILDFAQGVEDGKVSIDSFAQYLDEQVANGLISPEAAQALKDQMLGVQTQAGLAAAALAGLPAAVQVAATSLAQREGIPQYATERNRPGLSAAGSAVGPVITDFVRGALGAIAGQAKPLTQSQGLRIGLGDNPQEFSGMLTTDVYGRPWSWNKPSQTWVPKRAAGGHVGPGPVLVGESGPELVTMGTSGYVVNAARTAAMSGGSSAPVASGEVVHITVHGQAQPQQTAREIVRARRKQRYLAGRP